MAAQAIARLQATAALSASDMLKTMSTVLRGVRNLGYDVQVFAREKPTYGLRGSVSATAGALTAKELGAFLLGMKFESRGIISRVSSWVKVAPDGDSEIRVSYFFNKTKGQAEVKVSIQTGRIGVNRAINKRTGLNRNPYES